MYQNLQPKCFELEFGIYLVPRFAGLDIGIWDFFFFSAFSAVKDFYSSMKKRDRVSSLFWLGFGLLFAIGGWQQGLVKRGVPGPGFLPFICGLIMIGLALIVLVPTLGAEKDENKESAGQERFFPNRGSGTRLAYTLTALVAYGICLPYGGFLLITFIFMLFMLRLMEPQKWGRAVLLSLSTAILAYLLFAALEVQLPQGMLGI
jgi:hypothetical protein